MEIPAKNLFGLIDRVRLAMVRRRMVAKSFLTAFKVSSKPPKRRRKKTA
jgi:hypothetical protein